MEDVKICPICSSEAPPGTSHSVHYGGHCCFSCRAFFRRASQTPRQKTYKCKRGGNCVITPNSQQLCKRCRYDKCIKANMNPNSVLTFEEKQVRFQHYYKKKKEGAALSSRQPNSRPTHANRTVKRRLYPRPSATVTSESGDTSESSQSRPSFLQQLSSSTQSLSQQQGNEFQILPQFIPVQSTNLHSQQLVSNSFSNIVQIPSTGIKLEDLNGSNHIGLTSSSELKLSPISSQNQLWFQIPLSIGDDSVPKSPFVSTDVKLLTRIPVEETTQCQQANGRSQTQCVNADSKVYIYEVQENAGWATRHFSWANGSTMLQGTTYNSADFSTVEDGINDPPRSRLEVGITQEVLSNHPDDDIQMKNSSLNGHFNPGSSHQSRIEHFQILNSFIEKSKTERVRQLFNLESGANTKQTIDLNIASPFSEQKQKTIEIINSTFLDQSDKHSKFEFEQKSEPETTFVFLDSDKDLPISTPTQDPMSSISTHHSDLKADLSSSPEGDTKQLNHLKPGRSNSFPVQKLLTELKISTVLDAFALASGNMSMDCDKVQEMISMHQCQQPPQASSLISQLSSVALIMKNFADSLSAFTSLRKEDQLILLRHNIPLYLQYNMARYFSATTGIEQINWILEGQLLVTESKDVTLNKLSLEDYNEVNQLFESSEMLHNYNVLSERIYMNCPLSYHFNGLVANVLLFFTSEHVAEQLLEPERVRHSFEEAEQLLLECFKKIGLPILDDFSFLLNDLDHLKLMFYDCRIVQAIKRETQDIPKLVSLQYTKYEDDWINDHFKEFEKQQSTVSLPIDVLNGMIDYMLTGRHLIDHCFEVCYAMMTERNRRSFKSCSQLLSLSFRDEEALWRKNSVSATALSCLRVNALRTGKEQLKFSLGILDQHSTEWENDFKDSIDLNVLQSCYMHTSEQGHEKFDEFSLMYFKELLSELSNVIANDHIYKLFILVTLLDTEGLSNSPSFERVVQIRQIYFKFFHRKLMAAGCTFADYASFRKTQKRIKFFATMLQTFLS